MSTQKTCGAEDTNQRGTNSMGEVSQGARDLTLGKAGSRKVQKKDWNDAAQAAGKY